MACKNDTRLVCGYKHRTSDYLCMFNKLIIELNNFISYPKISILLSYEIVQKQAVIYYLNDYHRYMVREGTTYIPFDSTLFNILGYQSYLYTVWVAHGLGININIEVVVINYQTNAFVNIYDGPILVKSTTLYELASNRFRYQAGFRVTIGITMIDGFTRVLAKLSYSHYHYKPQVIHIENSTQTISIDTAKRNHNQIFYYKYLTVTTKKSKFVQMAFTNLAKFSEASEGCEDGGFALSDVLEHHISVTGPFCSQHGTEPLVNAINTFHSTQNFATIFIYSYKFQMKVDIVFSETFCGGITNPCDRFCNPNLELPTQNYWVKFTGHYLFCSGDIYIEKGCKVVQKTPAAQIYSYCDLTVIAYEGQIKTRNFHVINMIK